MHVDGWRVVECPSFSSPIALTLSLCASWRWVSPMACWRSAWSASSPVVPASRQSSFLYFFFYPGCKGLGQLSSNAAGTALYQVLLRLPRLLTVRSALLGCLCCKSRSLGNPNLFLLWGISGNCSCLHAVGIEVHNSSHLELLWNCKGDT